jgi:hypothetical protein
MKNYIFIAMVMIGILGWTNASRAACSNPIGNAGEQMYNSSHSVMQYCDGTDWTAMGGGGGGGGGSEYFVCSNEASDGDGTGDIADCVLATVQHKKNVTNQTAMPTIIPVGCRRPGDNKFATGVFLEWYAPTKLWYIWDGGSWKICNDGTQLFDKSTVVTVVGCAAQAVSWSGCRATTAARPHGGSLSITDGYCCAAGCDSSCSGATGSATATCNNGSWSFSGSTCSPCSVNGNSCSCFVAGTMIAMADGSDKQIEQVKIGDIVIGMDGAHNTVTGIEVPPLGERKLYAFNGGNFFVTEEHPFRLTSNRWASIQPESTLHEQPQFEVDNGKLKSLEIGDEIVMQNGKTMVIKTIESRGRNTQTMPVYNLLLDGNDTYFADGFLVHNKM